MRVCIACGERAAQPSEDMCLVCMWDDVCRAKRSDPPQRPAQQITLSLTPQQFIYLQAAVKRDQEFLEEMAPWDIDDQTAEHEAEVRMCKAMQRVLHAAPEMLKTLRFVLPTLRRASNESPVFDADGFNLQREAADEVDRAIRIAETGGE